MAQDVFISYSHVDHQIADAVCHKMEEEGIRCWYAPRDIRPGDEWAAAIVEALEHSKIMVLIFTDASNISTQVRREVSTAISAGVIVLPLKCTRTEPSGSMRYYLSTVHWLDAMDEPLESGITALVRHAKSLLQDKQSGEGGTQPAAEQNAEDANESPLTGKTAEEAAPVHKVPWYQNVKILAGLFAAVLVLMASVLFTVLWREKKSGGRNKEAESIQNITEQQAANSADPSENTDDAGGKETDTADGSAEKTADTADLQEAESKETEPAAGETDESAPQSEENKGAAYVFDEDNDSPGAEDYLYSVSSYLSDEYDVIILDKFFGDETAEIVIPEIIDGLPVAAIGEKCFEGCESIQKVVLPETVYSLGYRSFYGCTSLSDINLPEGLKQTLGWTFAHTALTEFIAPAGFESLGYGTFYSCEKLKNIVMTEAVDSIGADTFRWLADECRVVLPCPDIEIDVKGFDEDAKMTVAAPQGSYTEKYCKAMGLIFEPLP